VSAIFEETEKSDFFKTTFNSKIFTLKKQISLGDEVGDSFFAETWQQTNN
jgi:hypothetical protein